MKKSIFMIVISEILALTGSGCMFTQATPIPQDFQIEYHAGGCYGTCPVYSLKIHADGTGAYEGAMYVETMGAKAIKVSSEEMRELVQEVEKIKFFSLKKEYISDQTGDMGRRSIQVTENGRVQMITYDLGIPEIHELEALIEKTTNVEALVSATIEPALCVKSYGNLKRERDLCRNEFEERDRIARSLQQAVLDQDELILKREGLWKRIASSNNDARWIGISMLSAPLSIFYAEQWDKTVVIEKKKSPSGKQALVVFGQTYEPGDRPIQRGFYVLNEKSELVGSYIVPDVWEHFSIGSVAWKNEQRISYNYYLATEGDEMTPPEKREYLIKK